MILERNWFLAYFINFNLWSIMHKWTKKVRMEFSIAIIKEYSSISRRIISYIRWDQLYIFHFKNHSTTTCYSIICLSIYLPMFSICFWNLKIWVLFCITNRVTERNNLVTIKIELFYSSNNPDNQWLLLYLSHNHF